MLSPIAQRVLQNIHKRELMRPGDRVAVAVSGGADSVALLRLMLELRGELGVVLSVAHFNHKIRGQASDDDEAFVRDLAAQYGLEFHRGEGDVPVHARVHRMSLETAARELRHTFFASLAGEIVEVAAMVDKIATAHTLDDQAETVLMRILRGTGISGLSAIHPRVTLSRDGGEIQMDVVRPLISVRRAEIEEYLRLVQQLWRDDVTNTDLHHTRNRIRQLVVPLLEREFNPSVRERLAELAEIAREEEAFWRYRQHELSEEVTSPENFWLAHNPADAGDNPGSPPSQTSSCPPALWLRMEPLLRLTIAEQRRMVRNAAQAIGVTFEDVERVLSLARGDTRGEVQLPSGCYAWCEGGVLKFGPRPHHRRDSSGDEHRIALPLAAAAEFNVPGSRVHVRPIGVAAAESAILISKLPVPELILRPWRPGDRFWPQHSSGPKKVKELLTDKHITGPERKLWPVIASGEDIVWLRGFGVSQEFAAREGTSQVIVITEEPLPDSDSNC